MKNTVLVTGAGGFIGSAVIRRLVAGIEEGTLHFADLTPVEHVVALVRKPASLERLQELSGKVHWSVERVDVTDTQAFYFILEKIRPRVIIHLALNPEIFTETGEPVIQRLNDAPIETMFRFLSGEPDSRIIHTSSAWVLASGLYLAENAQVDPQSAYARAKFRIDKLLPVFQSRFDVDWINLRLFNVYGKYESRNRLLPYLVSTLPYGKKARLTHGNQVRDFNYVDDVAVAYVQALQADNSACNQVYHIGTGVGLSTREYAGIIAEVTGNAELIEFGAVDRPDQSLAELVADPSLARKILGWHPPLWPEERIKQAVRWWLDFNASS